MRRKMKKVLISLVKMHKVEMLFGFLLFVGGLFVIPATKTVGAISIKTIYASNAKENGDLDFTSNPVVVKNLFAFSIPVFRHYDGETSEAGYLAPEATARIKYVSLGEQKAWFDDGSGLYIPTKFFTHMGKMNDPIAEISVKKEARIYAQNDLEFVKSGGSWPHEDPFIKIASDNLSALQHFWVSESDFLAQVLGFGDGVIVIKGLNNGEVRYIKQEDAEMFRYDGHLFASSPAPVQLKKVKPPTIITLAPTRPCVREVLPPPPVATTIPSLVHCTFRYKTRLEIVEDLPPKEEIRVIKSWLASKIALSADRIELYASGSVVDDDMLLEDVFEPTEPYIFTIENLAEPAEEPVIFPKGTIVIFGNIVPRALSAKTFDSRAKCSDILKLAGAGFSGYLCNTFADTYEYVPPDTDAREISERIKKDPLNLTFVIREENPEPVAPNVIEQLEASVQAEAAKTNAMDEVSYFKIDGTKFDPSESLAAGEQDILFSLDGSKKIVIRINKDSNATVGEARKVVATALQAEEVGDISLFLTGKALKDGFPLKGLRIGKSEITIYKKDTATLVLLTARAAVRPVFV